MHEGMIERGVVNCDTNPDVVAQAGCTCSGSGRINAMRLAFALQSRRRVQQLQKFTRPPLEARPNSVPCGPRSTSIRSRS